MLPSLVVVLAGSSSTPQRRRLDVLFEVLSRTHGGPSFISRSDLLLLRAAAARRFEAAPREGEPRIISVRSTSQSEKYCASAGDGMPV